MALFNALLKRPFRAWQLALFALLFICVAVAIGYMAEQQAREMRPSLYPNLTEIDVQLVSHEGKAMTLADISDKPALVYFGFTYCPDICPTTLAMMAGQLAASDLSDDIQLILITVDPDRDTPEQLNDYLSLFDVPMLALTGAPDQIDKLLADMGVFRAEIIDEDGDISYDHTSSVFMFKKGGAFKGTISPVEPADFIADKLNRLLKS